MTVGKHTATVVVQGKTDSAEKALKQLNKQLDVTDKKLEKANRQGGTLGKTLSDPSKLGRAQSAFTGLTNSVGLLRAGLAGVAAGAAVQAVNKIRELSAESLKLQNIYANLPFSLDKARTATMGLVDDTTLATAALQAQRFGVVENAAEFAKLAEVATKLAVTSGQDAAKGIQDLTTAMSRQSPMILDNLGITLKLSTAQQRYAASLGKSAKDLTEAEKAEAFRVEAMKAAEKATENLEVVTDGFAASLGRAEIAAKNFRDSLLTGGGAGAGGPGPEQILKDLARSAGEAAAALEDSENLTSKQFGTAQSTLLEYELIQKALVGAVGEQSKLTELNERLAKLGAERAITAGELRDGIIGQVLQTRRVTEEEGLALQLQKERTEQQRIQQEEADQMLGFIDFSIKLARAEGQSQKEILALQDQRLTAQVQMLEAKLASASITEQEFETESAKLDQARAILDAQKARAARAPRATRRGPTREEQIKQLIEQADAGDRLAEAEQAHAELRQAWHEQETAAQAQQLQVLEERITQRQRQLEIEEIRGVETEGAKIARERELIDLQLEAARLREELAFTEEEREQTTEAREQLLHEQRVSRIEQRMRLEKKEQEAQAAALKKRQETSIGILNISKTAVEGYGKILSEGAKQRGATERQAFNIEKGIKAASLTLDSVTYGAKSAAAFAGGNFVQGAGFAIASSISAAAALQTLASSPDSIGAPGGAGGTQIAAEQPGIRNEGNERPDSNIPASPIDGRGATLPTGGAGAAGGGVSVSIGTFTTLGTVDDETGVKLAQALDRVKEDGLA